MKLVRKIVFGGCAVFLLLICLLLGVKWHWDAKVFEGYEADLPLDARSVDITKDDAFRVEKIEITGLHGERIPLLLALPKDRSSEPYPCMVLLYGIRQRMDFFYKIAPLFTARGTALAVPEQFHRGERLVKDLPKWREPIALRERSSRIVPETRRVVDYLVSRSDIDPMRIDLVGASYGGILGCAVFAHEPRFRSSTFIMAGGDFPLLFSDMVSRHKPKSRFVWPVMAKIAAWYVSPFEPLKHIQGAFSRPLLFLNVDDDELISDRASAVLYEAAPDPKKKITYSDVHDKISEATVARMIEDALTWAREQD